MPKKVVGSAPFTPPITETNEAGSASAPTAAPSFEGATMGLPPLHPRSTAPLGTVGQSWLSLQAGQAGTKDSWEIVPGRYPDIVGINQVLAEAGSPEERTAMIKGLMAHVQQITGLQVPDAVVAVMIKKPALVTDALRASPKEMSDGLKGLQKMIKEGKVQDVKPAPLHLGSKFDFANYANTSIEVKAPELKEIAPKLYFGSLPGKLSEAEAKSNIVTAEIFDRLAQNASAKSGRFSVSYGGKQYTRIETFVKALEKNGHVIEGKVQHRVANFTDLKTKGPDGKFCHVPFGLNTRTLVTNAAGKEADVPTVHSELIFSIRPGPNTKVSPNAPAISADIKFYQGISGTGFFPVGLTNSPAWLGLSEAPEKLTGSKAARALSLAGLLTDVIEREAKKKGLGVWGYGLTGVCNDSVAVVQHAVTGKTTCHPLLMIDSFLAPELKARAQSGSQRDRAGYAALLGAVKALPDDFELRPDTKERARASFPYKEHLPPTKGTEAAKAILFG